MRKTISRKAQEEERREHEEEEEEEEDEDEEEEEDAATGLLKVLAIDCEMCVSEDPLTGDRNAKELVRISVVGGAKGDTVVLDSLVQPAWPVVDMVTQVHGIKQEQLAGVTFTLRHAQAAMRKLVTKDTILVGHALNNDLKVGIRSFVRSFVRSSRLVSCSFVCLVALFLTQ